MAEIDVKTEQDQGRGWAFEVDVTDAGQTHCYDVTLSWSDYDLWCHGQVAPERVVRAAFRFLLEREPASAILSRFDCAVIRRYFPDVDKLLPGML
ncbi:MAG: hypothetical protein GC159_23460 [Phycisphaera sp.]|nr:hypothetical protein [Phycisphaera sp.]